jgi:hypothetical protein
VIELARAYLAPAKTISLPGAPGAPLNFSAGLCRIFDPRLVTIALRRPDVTVALDERYKSHLRQWLDACGEFQPARAKVSLPDGTVLHPPHYTTPAEDALNLYACEDD